MIATVGLVNIHHLIEIQYINEIKIIFPCDENS